MELSEIMKDLDSDLKEHLDYLDTKLSDNDKEILQMAILKTWFLGAANKQATLARINEGIQKLTAHNPNPSRTQGKPQ